MAQTARKNQSDSSSQPLFLQLLGEESLSGKFFPGGNERRNFLDSGDRTEQGGKHDGGQMVLPLKTVRPRSTFAEEEEELIEPHNGG